MIKQFNLALVIYLHSFEKRKLKERRKKKKGNVKERKKEQNINKKKAVREGKHKKEGKKETRNAAKKFIVSTVSISKTWYNFPIGRTLTVDTTAGQSGPESNGKAEVLHIPQCSSITGASPSGSLVSYPGHSCRGVLPLRGDAVGVFYSPGRLGLKVQVIPIITGVFGTVPKRDGKKD